MYRGGYAWSREAMDAVARALEGLPRVSAPSGFVEAVMKRVLAASRGAGTPEVQGRRSVFLLAGAAGAGVVVTGVAVALAVMRRLAGRRREEEAPALGGA